MEIIAMKTMVIDMEAGMMTDTIERGTVTCIEMIVAKAEIGIGVVETMIDGEREEIGMVEMSTAEIMSMKSVIATTGKVMRNIMIQGALEADIVVYLLEGNHRNTLEFFSIFLSVLISPNCSG